MTPPPFTPGRAASGAATADAPASAPLSPDEVAAIDAWWRAANYLSVGQIYLRANPLLREPLALAHVKPRLLGHWGTTPGLNFVWAHVNRLIRERDVDAIFVCGPGHGGPAVVACTYLEGSYGELYPDVGMDEGGLERLFTQFSWPGGIPSHAAPETPGSIHEGGELGYALVHAYGAAFDNPELVVCAVVGDGEAETGALAASWHSNKFLNPATDGAVLPVLHLNGYRIAGPTVLARIPEAELDELLRGYGHEPIWVSGDEPAAMHQRMAAACDVALDAIRRIQRAAREEGVVERPRWPMIVLRTPKGWTGPKEVDGKPTEGSFRSHQVPLSGLADNPAHLAQLEEWLRSYRPEELFDDAGRLVPELAALAPTGDRRMGANPHANGGRLLKELAVPDFRRYAVDVPAPGAVDAEATRVLGALLRDVLRANEASRNFRVFGPDETSSNRLDAVFEATDRMSMAEILPGDVHVSRDGRVMEVLSEHLCQGWLEGYLLTGRHGFFSCYEAFIHIVDSMFNQHAKWLKTTREIPWRAPIASLNYLLTGRHGFFSCYEAFIHIVDSMFNQHAKWLKTTREIPWRAPIASLNYLLTSHVWRQDHNGFSHQDPGFLDHVANKKADVVRIYLPPDANTLLSVADHCLRSRHYVNVIVAGKQPAPQWLDMDAAVAHCARGLGVWEWAGTEDGSPDGPDVVLACAGDVPTLETLAAASLLREHVPHLRVRVVNVVDLMTLQSERDHPHGLADAAFDAVFTADRPVIFAFHGYPSLVHRLTYRRANHAGMHVHGYQEEGTTTTPFDMTVLNRLDRYHLALDAIARAPRMRGDARGEAAAARFRERLETHARHVRAHGEDLPEIRDWRWAGA